MTPAQQKAVFVVRVVAGLLFWQHGLQKLVGFAGTGPEPTFWSIRGVGGFLEGIGGPMLTLGILTRPTTFILSGEMAVAYFRSWAPRGFFPIANGGEEAVLNCFLFLWLFAAGGGAWSVDSWIERRAGRSPWWGMARWEPPLRALLRLIVGFLLTLHGLRALFGILPSVGGRRNAPPLALDALPAAAGYIELVGGLLLILGLAVRPTSVVLGLQALVAYVFVAQRRAVWPVANGGIEALLYAAIFLYFAVAGAGVFRIDQFWRTRTADGTVTSAAR